MGAITVLILFPLLAALAVYLVREDEVRNKIVRVSAGITAVLTLIVVCLFFNKGIAYTYLWEKAIDFIMAAVEVALAAYIIVTGIRYKNYAISILSFLQTAAMLCFELTVKSRIEVDKAIIFDKLTAVMVVIVGVVGSLICIYAVGYMKTYHIHHTEYEDRKGFFFAVLFLFLSAMFGIVLSNQLTWMYFCWELTTFCSYLLIGYTKTKEARNNSFRALFINLLGGAAFAAGIIIIGISRHTLELSVFTAGEPDAFLMIPVFLLSLAALTKSAQLPFSSWLLGAMVAPTPTSALLHSATMVKAGVYLIIRLAPLLGDSAVGKTVTLVGGVTFLACSFMAISQSDAKKVLAYSTLANLGLIVICASVGTEESIWAAILLIIFHAVSKSLLFISVGSAEHQIGNRNVENMDMLLGVSRKLALCMMIGIAGMFLAPFGMLISKWVAMKAFIDSNNILIVIILAYGSAATLFYWAKWMGKLVSKVNMRQQSENKFHLDEEIPITILAGLVVVSCFTFPVVSKYALIPYLSGVFHNQALMPIGEGDIKLMLYMLSMLIILPVSFIPVYKNDKRRKAPIYMAGENTGDNETFYASFGGTRQVELRNWYMDGYFGTKRLSFFSDILSFVILVWGVILLIGGIAS
ncbi:NADH-quinone oxidoreductase subunit L [Lacrimispora amygdalina]|uniref:NADH-quinone oxidoreductase subunit L n=1 Tax=Lacrimispora amygdalina TaxID=253257 RepID=A0A3E2NI37_9FIRM|nr:proton-conducting transporter membrane subunit [Clostridium indicum]RFZ80672.1 NADH-quinone oxidoreductase subunit L [Clostridium indicum]